MSITWRATRVPFALALACSLAACGGNPNSAGDSGGDTEATNTYTKFEEMAVGEDRAAELQACAEDEGELLLNSSANVVAELGTAFEDEFGISTKVVSPTQDEAQRQRLLQQHQAGKTTTDVILSYGTEFENVYAPEGVSTQYTSPTIEDGDIASGLQSENFVALWLYPMVPAYNTDLLSEADLPETYADLADPEWDGKIGLVNGDGPWYYSLHNALVTDGDMTEEEFADVFRAIGKNARAFEGHGSVSLVESGEIPLLLTNLVYSGSMELVNGDAPVALHPLEPISIDAFGAGLTTDAPHPCSAVMFLEWAMKDGQQIIADNSYYPAFKDEISGDPIFEFENYEHAYVPFQEVTPEEFAAWESAYDEGLLQASDDVVP